MSQRNVYVQEVAPRDGLQNESVFVDTADKITLINRLSECGYTKIEATSFTSPKAIPALSDADAVMRGINRRAGVIYTALVPNVRGVERALACDIDEVNFVMSVSETHNRTNLRMARDKSVEQLRDIAMALRGTRTGLNVSLSTVFGCPMEGHIDVSEVQRLVGYAMEAGAQGITLCDTTGMAFPTQVAAIGEEVLRRCPGTTITLHFHNTRGMAMANVLASLDVGITHFDASLGGLGGCPYAPGASGNVCTEDMVHMLELMGHNTALDLNAILETAKTLPALIGRELPSYLVKAGPRSVVHPVPVGLG